MSKELVSIITPAFKAAPYVSATISSVLRQTYDNWEILVVDDGSPDDTSEIVETIAATDRRVRLIRQENAGPAMARQMALDHASGRYIAFLDRDDLWLPEKLERQLSFMSDLNACLSFTAFRRISADGSLVGRVVEIPSELTYHQLLGNTAIATSTVLVDRDKSGPLKMRNTYYDDFALWLDILRPGRVGYGLNEDLMRYRVLTGSVSRNKLRSARMVWKTYRELENLGRMSAAHAFSRYMWHALWKYREF